ncbi:hypothetical protein OOU_Y34scaffold00806g2 [Pyricularia oryzae Y34]|uniref:PD-(D/E)XK nuclease-like domain-containing protein n=1 Tax=Pyricularia oryzae (strain Y34) TaxID=1143189 RepID=A0AA97NPY8_PYRO3|nr:hypothetical protein OOU_Y34scaffold00806g2 [Pyricularia oryzae Y34]
MASNHTHLARTLCFSVKIRVDQVFWQYCRGKDVRPIGVNVETKASAAAAEQGRIQLALWTIAWYKRVQALVDSCADDICLPDAMPVILVTEHAWNLAFICNRGGEAFELIVSANQASTASRILHQLPASLAWVNFCELALNIKFSDLSEPPEIVCKPQNSGDNLC